MEIVFNAKKKDILNVKEKISIFDEESDRIYRKTTINTITRKRRKEEIEIYYQYT